MAASRLPPGLNAVAIFGMQIGSLSRGAGRRATAAAAYRAGARVRDERSGQLYNFSQRRDVLHSELLLPAQFDVLAVPWARQRERLWNVAELIEKRHNARVAREFQVLLPHELDASQRVELARGFARELAERYHVAVDLAVHAPRPGSDARNFHAHLLATTRELTPTGLGAKTGLDMHARERRRRGLPDHSAEYVNVRARWALHVNEALRAANIDARVDHRSLAAQGISRAPRHVPFVQLKIAQRALRGELTARLKDEYRARLQRGLAATPASPAPARDVQEIRRQAREAWLRLRPQSAERSNSGQEQQATAAAAGPTSRQREDDLAL